MKAGWKGCAMKVLINLMLVKLFLLHLYFQWIEIKKNSKVFNQSKTCSTLPFVLTLTVMDPNGGGRGGGLSGAVFVSKLYSNIENTDQL